MPPEKKPAGPLVGIVAGEPSGDLLGGALVQALRKRIPGTRFVGIGGPQMMAAGVQSLFPLEKLAVRGYVEVLRHYCEIIAIRRELKKYFLRERPTVFIGIDAPDFNLDLEAGLKATGIPTVHYVSPSIWAWRGERIHKIRRAVSHMLVVFPFEEEIYRRAGIPVTYVGHPLADRLPLEPDMATARRTLGIEANGPVIALLPGSRQGEVKRLAPLMLEAARRILKAKPSAHFLIPAATEAVESRLRKQADASGLPVRVLRGESHTVMTAADVVVLASGTATLEAALLKKPMVITYKVPAITAWIARGKLYLPYVGLPNILLKRFAVPELLQENATPENLAREVLAWLDAPERCEALKKDFRALHESLRCNAGERIAEALEPYLL